MQRVQHYSFFGDEFSRKLPQLSFGDELLHSSSVARCGKTVLMENGPSSESEAEITPPRFRSIVIAGHINRLPSGAIIPNV